MTNPVLKTSLFVVKRAKSVSISGENIKKLASDLSKKNFKTPEWDRKNHLFSRDVKTLSAYFFVLDTLQSCFWSKKERWFVKINGKFKTGYFALSNCLKIFFEKHPEKADFSYFSSISFQEFKGILQGGKNLMFLEERWQNLRAVSHVFVKKYKGNPELFLSLCSKSCEKFVKKVVSELPSFKDEASYCDRKIFFWKRAEILAGDVFGALNDIGVKAFNDIEWLTAFADYKVPQILNHLGILKYSAALDEKIKKQVILKNGSREEVEIRAASVVAVRFIAESLRESSLRVYDFEIDWFLWNLSKKKPLKNNHHLTPTTFY